MRIDPEGDLSRLDSLVKNGQGYIINNIGKIIALITLLIACIVTFTNVSFSAFGSENFTVSLFIMLCASYIMYFSLEASGERLGESSEDFLSAVQKYDAVRKRISSDNIEALRAFCLEYAKKDAEYQRRSAMLEAGISEKEYKDCKAGVKLPKRIERAIKRCDRITPKGLTPSLLLSKERLRSRCEPGGPMRARMISAVLGLLPTTVGTFFTVSVMLTIKESLTVSAIIEGIVKLSALPLIGFKGYSSGYSFAKNIKSHWIETKAEILEEFLTLESQASYSDE